LGKLKKNLKGVQMPEWFKIPAKEFFTWLIYYSAEQWIVKELTLIVVSKVTSML